MPVHCYSRLTLCYNCKSLRLNKDVSNCGLPVAGSKHAALTSALGSFFTAVAAAGDAVAGLFPFASLADDCVVAPCTISYT